MSRRILLGLMILLAVQPVNAANQFASAARTLFTLEIVDREPKQDLGPKIDPEVKSLTYFTELRGLKGQTVSHRWLHNNKLVNEVKFNVRGQRWRVWSTKTLAPRMKGKWFVQVMDGQGNILAEDPFIYGQQRRF